MGMVHHKTTSGKQMTFHDKQWLTDIYRDNAHKLVIKKCSQVHMTEHALCGMYTLARKGKRGMYILPSKEHRRSFVADRINRMKDYSRLYEMSLKEGTKDGSDSNVLKTIFGQTWKFVGSNVRKDFFEFPCDVLLFDEYDLLDQDNIAYAYDRIANSRNPYVWKFGNPTIDGEGIDKEYSESDQREWHVQCHCGYEQTLDWYSHFVKEVEDTFILRHPAGMPICEKCGEPFNRLGHGRWIPLNPGSKIHGYKVSRLFVNKSKSNKRGHQGSQDILKLFKKFIDAQFEPIKLQNFHNNYLAETYEHADFKITDTLLQKCALKDKIDEYDPTVFRAIMGVDQGKFFTCTISIIIDNVIYDVLYANVKRWKDVEDLEEKYNVIYTIVDAQGGGYAETRDFLTGKSGRYMCYYRSKDRVKETYNKDESTQVVEVNRTEILDLVVKQMKEGKCKIPKNYKSQLNGEWKKQMKASSRVQDTAGRPIWTKGKDHFFHSAAYRLIAKLISGMSNSVLNPSRWHVDNKTAKKSYEPKEGTIGDSNEQPVVTEDKPEKKKKKSWRV